MGVGLSRFRRGFRGARGPGLLAALAAAAFLPGAGHAAVIGTVTADGYVFTNFDPTLTGGSVGSNANGISNTGQLVGTEVDANNASTGVNYAGFPASNTLLNTGDGQTAFGINSAGNVVGGNGSTGFYLPKGGSPQPLANTAFAFGINDSGGIVGQSASGAGFYLPSAASVQSVTIDAPSGPDTVNAQGINNAGLVVGFYLGNDGNTHGFEANIAGVPLGGSVTGTALADPVIPSVAGEPGATFVFSQVLGVNDNGIAVGYYGDSTTSQHGFLYNLATGTYTFLDDPAEAFVGGVETTQITGISNIGELSGFYIDGNGIAHSFAACPVGEVCPLGAVVPEPAPWAMMLVGFGALGPLLRRRRARTGLKAA